MLSGCPGENMNTFLIMAHSAEERRAFLSTLCKISTDLFHPPTLLLMVCCTLGRMMLILVFSKSLCVWEFSGNSALFTFAPLGNADVVVSWMEREGPVPASSNLWGFFLADIVNTSVSLALLSILNYITRAVLNMASQIWNSIASRYVLDYTCDFNHFTYF